MLSDPCFAVFLRKTCEIGIAARGDGVAHWQLEERHIVYLLLELFEQLDCQPLATSDYIAVLAHLLPWAQPGEEWFVRAAITRLVESSTAKAAVPKQTGSALMAFLTAEFLSAEPAHRSRAQFSFFELLIDMDLHPPVKSAVTKKR